MKQILLGASPNHMKRRLSKIMTASLLTSCFVLLPIVAQAGNPHGSPTPTPTPSPTITPSPTPTSTPAGDLGNGNTAIGNGSLLSLTTGGYNTANGFEALFNNTTGFLNTAAGSHSLFSNTTGGDNTAVGDLALYSNTTGNGNDAFGGGALYSNSTGIGNNAFGGGALYNNTTGEKNTAMGFLALSNNTTGNGNVAIGAEALASSTEAGYEDVQQSANVAIGYRALTNASGTGGAWYGGNVAVGDRALESSTDGHFNSAFGSFALNSITTGSYNVAIGVGAGIGVTTGIGNIFIGLSETSFDPNDQYHTYIGNINTTSVSGGSADTVTIDLNTGLLGHLTSSRRHKEDIKAMDDASETLFRLKPVTYRYKKEIDRNQVLDYGLIAEEVAEIDPNLALRDAKGEIESVRYNAINIMLLNEFLKEHKKVEEQQVTINDLKKDLGVLTAQLKEQAAQIQKVSAQLEMRRPLTRVARSYP